ncbi:MAG: type II secretion system F family protein [Planctomycetota bacterium]
MTWLLVAICTLVGVTAACALSAGAAALVRLRCGAEPLAQQDPSLAASPWRQLVAGVGVCMRGAGADRRRSELATLAARAAIRDRSGAELLGRCRVHGACAALVGAVLFGCAAGPVGIVVGSSLGVAGFAHAWQAIAAPARRRMRRLRAELPFALDLAALCLQAGGSLTEAMVAVARADDAGPLGAELDGVARETELGRTWNQALEAWQRRLQIPELDHVVGSLVRAQALGAPLAETLAELAENARHRRYAAAETAASEAPARMVGPTVLIVLAAVLLIAGPAVITLMSDTGL